MNGQMKRYSLPGSFWDTPEPVSLAELRKRMDGKFPNLPKLFEYAKAHGKKVTDLTDEEKNMFIE